MFQFTHNILFVFVLLSSSQWRKIGLSQLFQIETILFTIFHSFQFNVQAVVFVFVRNRTLFCTALKLPHCAANRFMQGQIQCRYSTSEIFKINVKTCAKIHRYLSIAKYTSNFQYWKMGKVAKIFAACLNLNSKESNQTASQRISGWLLFR